MVIRHHKCQTLGKKTDREPDTIGWLADILTLSLVFSLQDYRWDALESSDRKKKQPKQMSRLLLYLINLLSPTRPAHYEVGKLSISANHQLCFKIPQIRKPA